MKSETVFGKMRARQRQINVETIGQGLSLILVLWFVLFSPLVVTYQLVALAFLPPLWIALRHGKRGALLATAGVDVLLALNIFVKLNLPEQWLALLPTLIVLSLATLILGWCVSQNQRTSSTCTTLRSETDRLHAILDALPALISYIDADERYQFNNLAYQQWFNLPSEKITGNLVRDVIGEASYQGVKDLIHSTLAGQSVLSHTIYYREPSERWREITYIPDIGTNGHEAGKVKGLVGIVRDVTKEKRTEHALGDARELNRKILEVTAIGISVYTIEGECVLTNEAAARNIGAPNMQAMFINFQEMQSWRDSGILDMVNQVVATGVARRQEFHLVTTFGKDVWLDFQAALLTANDKTHILVVSDDISQRIYAEQEVANHRQRLEELVWERTANLQTSNLQLQQAMVERERAEKALRQSEEHFRLLAENSQDTIFRYDLFPEPHLTYVSPAILHLTGYSPEEHLANQNLTLELIDVEDQIRLGAVMMTPSEFREPLEMRWRRKDGSYVWSEQRHIPIYDEEGRCVTIVGITRDITRRRQADEQFRKLSSAVEQSSVSITIIDAEGYIEYVNPRFTQITGYTFDDVYGKKPRILQPRNVHHGVSQQLWQTLQSGGEWRGELSNRTKTGKPYWESGVISPIYDNQEHITHYLAVMEDITQRKQQEREREAILAITLALRAANDSEEMLALILREITTTFDAGKVFFITPDPTTGEMIVEARYENGEFQPALGLRIPPGKGVAAQVYHTSQPYVTDNAFNDPLFAAPDLLGEDPAAACVPLVSQEMTIGLFSVTRKVPMTNNDVRLLVAIADMAATGLRARCLSRRNLAPRNHLGTGGC